ncbi:HD domain-containing protein [Singulisphaera sp. GP187]|uniref:HD domain-containing protein n=1 Tax=Singulisphaera sp. GP187 TaxID=1882752 RepID=UPI00092696C2|nr:HD domain-containing protein [Singulisphaera sp. GP187]SIO45523.1 HD domain-containing protein [Singulisphaera sp. GP187]
METSRDRELMSFGLERALRWGAVAHDGQFRKGVKTPYFEHVVGVAMILDRLGFEEAVVIAGLLHDVVEDTEATLDQVRERFGDEVARTVEACSEIKTDAQGRKRPWIDRKRDHLKALAGAPLEVRAVILADKLHNLLSMACDLEEGRPVWSLFNASRADLLGYYRATIDLVGVGDPRLQRLAERCRQLLDGLAEDARGGRDERVESAENREKQSRRVD